MIAVRNPMREPADRDGINTVHLSDGARVHLDDIATAAKGQSYLDDLDASIDAIEMQLDRNDDDADWRRRAETALKRKRRMRPRLQQRIGELRRAERQSAPPLPSGRPQRTQAADLRRVAFINAAETMLDRDLFVEIWQRASEAEPAAFEGWKGIGGLEP